MKKINFNNMKEAVDYLYNIPRFTTKHTAAETSDFLEKMGNPEKGMKIIHVAGTNGKGSTCSYLRYILEEAGYSVALFTSPHLVDVRERFVIRGRMISEAEFMEAFLAIYDMLDWEHADEECFYHPTFFEFVFFMAMHLFKEASCDFVILETGLGGRLDATNSVTNKLLSVITRISLEHTEYLGDTIEKIAGEKAGIMKEGVPTVFSDVEPEASEVFFERGRELSVKTYPVSKDMFSVTKKGNKNIDFSISTRYYNYVGLCVNTIAVYQVENAALAACAAEILLHDICVNEGVDVVKSIVNGIAKASWAGRMEEIAPEIFVDGAHNDDGVRAFIESVSEDGCTNGRKLLFSVVSDKDYHSMVHRICASGLFNEIAVAHMQTGRALSREKLIEIFDAEQTDCKVSFFDSVMEAYDFLLGRREDCRIYAAGSLYLVGEIKEGAKI